MPVLGRASFNFQKLRRTICLPLNNKSTLDDEEIHPKFALRLTAAAKMVQLSQVVAVDGEIDAAEAEVGMRGGDGIEQGIVGDSGSILVDENLLLVDGYDTREVFVLPAGRPS